MKRFRLHKDIKIRWKLLTNGEATDLYGRDLTLFIVSRFGTKKQPFHTEQNCIVSSFKGTEQWKIGEYWLTVYENYGKDGQTLVDSCEHFELVPSASTCADCDSGELNIGVGSDGCGCGSENCNDLELGVQGDSAYEIWLKNGHEGTLEDFISWLREPATYAAEKADFMADKANSAAKEASTQSAYAKENGDLAKKYGEAAKSIVESFQIISSAEYEALAVKDKDKLYLVYEDETEQ